MISSNENGAEGREIFDVSERLIPHGINAGKGQEIWDTSERQNQLRQSRVLGLKRKKL
jgi:hypothetical protein